MELITETINGVSWNSILNHSNKKWNWLLKLLISSVKSLIVITAIRNGIDYWNNANSPVVGLRTSQQ